MLIVVSAATVDRLSRFKIRSQIVYIGYFEIVKPYNGGQILTSQACTLVRIFRVAKIGMAVYVNQSIDT